MSFSGAAQTPVDPTTQAASPSVAAPTPPPQSGGTGYYFKGPSGNLGDISEYTGPVKYSATPAGPNFEGVAYSPSEMYADNGAPLYSYDTSKYSSPAYAALDSLNGEAGLAGGLSSVVKSLGINPNDALVDLQRYAMENPLGDQGNHLQWLGSPVALAQALGMGSHDSNIESKTKNFVGNNQALFNEGQQYTDYAHKSNHPQMSMTGSDYAQIIASVLSMAFPAMMAYAAPAAGAAAAGTAESSGMAEMFGAQATGGAGMGGSTMTGVGEAGLGSGTEGLSYADLVKSGYFDDFATTGLSAPGADIPATGLTTTDQLTQIAENQAKKFALRKLSGQKSNSGNPTQYVQPVGDALSSFAEGGVVKRYFDDGGMFDDGGGDYGDYGDYGGSDYQIPDFTGYEPPSGYSSDFSSAYQSPSDWSNSLGMGLPQGSVIDPENQGGGMNMSGFDASATGQNGIPTAQLPTQSDAATGPADLLKKLGYTDKNGELEWGKVLKGGSSVLGLVAALMQNKKLQSSGAQTAANMIQPAKIFTTGPGLTANYGTFARGAERAPYKLYAQGGLSLGASGPHHGPGSVHGPGSGQQDLVPAHLSPGEYVMDADTVASLGDGNSEEGARRLDAWREQLRAHKRSAPNSKIPPPAESPSHYLKGG